MKPIIDCAPLRLSPGLVGECPGSHCRGRPCDG